MEVENILNVGKDSVYMHLPSSFIGFPHQKDPKKLMNKVRVI